MGTWKAATVGLAVALAAAIGYALYLRQGPLERSRTEGRQLAGEIAELRATSSKAETEFKARIAEQAQRVQALQQKVAQLEASLSAAQAQQAAAAREHREKVGSLETHLARGQKQIAALGERIADLQRARDAARAQLADVQARLAESTQRLEALAREKATAAQIQAQLVESLRTQIRDKDLQITAMRNELRITMLGKVLFNPGNAVITAHGRAVLKSLAEQLKKVSGVRIVVRGHTDDQPLAAAARAVYIDNLGLSVERAAAVGRTLRAMGVPPQRLSAAGYSMYRPVASNANAEGRQQNRRVEVVLIPLSSSP